MKCGLGGGHAPVSPRSCPLPAPVLTPVPLVPFSLLLLPSGSQKARLLLTLSTQTGSYLTLPCAPQPSGLKQGGQRGGGDLALPGSWAGVRGGEVLGQGPASAGWAGGGPLWVSPEPQVPWEVGRALCMEAHGQCGGFSGAPALPRIRWSPGGRCVSSTLTVMS